MRNYTSSEKLGKVFVSLLEYDGIRGFLPSKEISKYGAHNQRAMVSVKITYSEEEHIWIEDLVNDIEKCASSELYPLLKREDEKYVTEHAYENPKFVEDVLRDVVLLLRKNDVIDSFEVECESIESIHNHSAWAYQQEIN